MSSSNKPNAPVYACPWRLRPTQSYRLPTPAGNCLDFEFKSSLGVSVAEAAITMMSAVCTCFVLSRSKYTTPDIFPCSSIINSLTIQLVRNSQLPVDIAVGITVLCVPDLAFNGHPKPQHDRLRTHAGRPLYSTEFLNIGMGKG